MIDQQRRAGKPLIVIRVVQSGKGGEISARTLFSRRASLATITRNSSMDAKLTTLSKFLSLVLRHEPQRIGLALDANGWANVDELLAKAAEHGRAMTREMLGRIVAENEKHR